jgi:hypothetical protein
MTNKELEEDLETTKKLWRECYMAKLDLQIEVKQLKRDLDEAKRAWSHWQRKFEVLDRHGEKLEQLVEQSLGYYFGNCEPRSPYHFHWIRNDYETELTEPENWDTIDGEMIDLLDEDGELVGTIYFKAL